MDKHAMTGPAKSAADTRDTAEWWPWHRSGVHSAENQVRRRISSGNRDAGSPREATR